MEASVGSQYYHVLLSVLLCIISMFIIEVTDVLSISNIVICFYFRYKHVRNMIHVDVIN